MYMVQDSFNDLMGFFYFFSLVIIGFYFSIQLLLATLAQNYNTIVDVEKERQKHVS